MAGANQPHSIVKPKTQRGKRAQENKQAKIHENDKTAMFIRGGHTSNTVTSALKDLYLLKKPNAIMFQRRNIMRPFEDQTSIEFFSDRNDSSLFLFGSHSKKRPDNLVLGRTFDHHILDMIELGIAKYIPLSEFKCPKIALATKPCLIFAGELFDTDHEHRRLKNLFIDFFRGPAVTNIRLQGIEHVYQFTAAQGRIYLRSYKIQLKKSGSRNPRVELEEMGPSFDLVVRRTHLASDDLFKRATRKPKTAKPRKKKNVAHDVFGTKTGKIHMQKQNLDRLQTRKMKGLKRSAPKENPDIESKKSKS